MLLNWRLGVFTSFPLITMPSVVSALRLSRTLTLALLSPLKRNAGLQLGTYWKQIGMKRLCKNWIMKRQQRSYASHTNKWGTGENVAVYEFPLEERHLHFVVLVKSPSEILLVHVPITRLHVTYFMPDVFNKSLGVHCIHSLVSYTVLVHIFEVVAYG